MRIGCHTNTVRYAQLYLVNAVISIDWNQKTLLLRNSVECNYKVSTVGILDLFFDAYERLLLRHFGEVMEAIVFFRLVS